MSEEFRVPFAVVVKMPTLVVQAAQQLGFKCRECVKHAPIWFVPRSTRIQERPLILASLWKNKMTRKSTENYPGFLEATA